MLLPVPTSSNSTLRLVDKKLLLLPLVVLLEQFGEELLPCLLLVLSHRKLMLYVLTRAIRQALDLVNVVLQYANRLTAYFAPDFTELWQAG